MSLSMQSQSFVRVPDFGDYQVHDAITIHPSNIYDLDLSNNGIRNIEFLENFSNLKKLNLSNNQIRSITGLEKLVNLEELNLSNNMIIEISGLESLVNLKYLYLDNNLITRITLPILPKLHTLRLGSNFITKMENLGSVSNLVELNLGHNKIERIEGLSSLTSLEELELDFNQISIIEGLETLSRLKVLNLNCNTIEHLDNIKHLNLEELFIISNRISNVPREFENTPSSLRIYCFKGNPCSELLKPEHSGFNFGCRG